MKLKIYVLMIARRYPAYHPLKGQYTTFYGQISDGRKIHTIRKNYALWQKRILEVQLGKALLELRQWEGLPYRSKQITLETLSAADGVGIQRYSFIPQKEALDTTPEEVAKNDGLSFESFQNWFRLVTKDDELAIIHFTPFRYKYHIGLESDMDEYTYISESGKYAMIVEPGQSDFYINQKYFHSFDFEMTESQFTDHCKLATETFDFNYNEG